MKEKFLEMVKQFAPQNFNDFLALCVLVIIPVFWILQGFDVVNLAPEVTGALIVSWSLILQFYFRKSQGGD